MKGFARYRRVQMVKMARPMPPVHLLRTTLSVPREMPGSNPKITWLVTMPTRSSNERAGYLSPDRRKPTFAIYASSWWAGDQEMDRCPLFVVRLV